jgi:hypothetical protein
MAEEACPPKHSFMARRSSNKMPGRAFVCRARGNILWEINMLVRTTAAALLGAALLTGSAFAQSTTPPASPSTPAASPSTPPASTTSSASSASTMSDSWRASKFVGLDVYNDKDEKIGDISELILDKSGKIDMVVIGVGGFLGMGQRDVAVKFSDLKFMTEPRRAAATTGAGNTSPAPAAGANTAATTNANANATKRNYPEYAVLANAPQDSVKSMPEFKY